MVARIITRIHVCQATIRRNRKEGTNDPPIIVRNYRGSIHAHEVEVEGSVHIRHSPHKPLNCGARVWIETDAPVRIIHDTLGEEVME